MGCLMKNSRILISSNNTYMFNILDSIQVEVRVEDNPYHIPLESLFEMAARINKRRSFLFVSKLIGKHIPIHPAKGLLVSALLASRYYETVKNGNCEFLEEWVSSLSQTKPVFTGKTFVPAAMNPVVIGFAETATALGHAFFDCFEKADYFHTTRDILQEQSPLITFEEEHSHATSHRCYIPKEILDNNREIILVDDELTTGKTALNIIRAIHERFPRKEYTVAALLDWRTDEHKRDYALAENLLGITIHVVSLLTGSILVNQVNKITDYHVTNHHAYGNEPIIEEVHLEADFSTMNIPSILSNGTVNRTPYLMETGRFGITSISNKDNQQKWVKIASFLKEKRSPGKSLCLGTGEFMYIPMKIAAEMGEEVSYQSTTRSPIFTQNIHKYGARYQVAFPNPEDMGISHFVYNIPPGYYSDLFLFFERETDRDNLMPLLKEIKKTLIKSIKLVYFTRKMR